MARPVKHVHLHRIGPTELRVVSDVDEGVLAIVQQEEAVIRAYMAHGPWPHRQVSLYILKDLQPLVRQLKGGALPPGGPGALDTRPIVNLFDLANPGACHIFVNRQAMVQADYWDDMLAISGLLAHEHAHPLAENRTTRASRNLTVELALQGGAGATPDQQGRLERLLTLLIEQLTLYAPREIFTNERAITGGFDQAMLHLNRRNVANACQSVAGRARLRDVLAQDVAAGSRPAEAVGQLLLAGDLESHLPLALEVAPFARASRHHEARELEGMLEQVLFPQLEPQVAPAYAALCRLYTDLSADLSPADLQAWGQRVADIVLAALREQGMAVRCTVRETSAASA
ncbi:MAG: hypothetical protein HGA45_04900 [Chloroflexales bacterium]|nr:hypothetical protein [Chloroflexales bacterium]